MVYNIFYSSENWQTHSSTISYSSLLHRSSHSATSYSEAWVIASISWPCQRGHLRAISDLRAMSMIWSTGMRRLRWAIYANLCLAEGLPSPFAIVIMGQMEFAC